MILVLVSLVDLKVIFASFSFLMAHSHINALFLGFALLEFRNRTIFVLKDADDEPFLIAVHLAEELGPMIKLLAGLKLAFLVFAQLGPLCHVNVELFTFLVVVYVNLQVFGIAECALGILL